MPRVHGEQRNEIARHGDSRRPLMPGGTTPYTHRDEPVGKASSMERIWHVKRCRLFDHLVDEQLIAIERGSRMKSFERGAVVYLPRDASSHVFLLAEGRVKLCHSTADGKEAILAFVDPGEIFGELALTAPAEREERAETVEKSTIVMIAKEVLERAMADDPRLSLGVTKLVGLRRQRVERRLKSLLFRSNRERVVDLLRELAERYGRPGPQGLEITLRLSHQELANVIGATRETVTVVLGELQAEGLVSLGRKRIWITNPARLGLAGGSTRTEADPHGDGRPAPGIRRFTD